MIGLCRMLGGHLRSRRLSRRRPAQADRQHRDVAVEAADRAWLRQSKIDTARRRRPCFRPGEFLGGMLRSDGRAAQIPAALNVEAQLEAQPIGFWQRVHETARATPALAKSGPCGTWRLPRWSAPPASMMFAPPRPLAFISSRSRVMASLVTLPLSHHHQHWVRAIRGGFFQPSASGTIGSGDILSAALIGSVGEAAYETLGIAPPNRAAASISGRM